MEQGFFLKDTFRLCWEWLSAKISTWLNAIMNLCDNPAMSNQTLTIRRFEDFPILQSFNLAINRAGRFEDIITGLPKRNGITVQNPAKQNDSKITDDEVVARSVSDPGNLTERFFAALRTTFCRLKIFESN